MFYKNKEALSNVGPREFWQPGPHTWGQVHCSRRRWRNWCCFQMLHGSFQCDREERTIRVETAGLRADVHLINTFSSLITLVLSTPTTFLFDSNLQAKAASSPRWPPLILSASQCGWWTGSRGPGWETLCRFDRFLWQGENSCKKTKNPPGLTVLHSLLLLFCLDSHTDSYLKR